MRGGREEEEEDEGVWGGAYNGFSGDHLQAGVSECLNRCWIRPGLLIKLVVARIAVPDLLRAEGDAQDADRYELAMESVKGDEGRHNNRNDAEG